MPTRRANTPRPATRGPTKVRANADFAQTFASLRALLQMHAPKALVTRDVKGDYQIASPTLVDRVGRPLAAAGVQIKKTYVSFHLIPVYAIPALAQQISPELKKRMQGKSCFNFTTLDPAHAKELAALTKKGVPMLEKVELPWIKKRER